MEDNRGKAQQFCLLNSTDTFAFFYKEVKDAQQKQSIQLSENVEFYLVQLLCNFVRASDQTILDDCLVNTLKKAVESLPHEKIALYKKLADTALYFSGFYQEYFTNKSFDIKYYVSMGESAYQTLSVLLGKKNHSQNAMSQIYKEMSEQFLNSVDILLCISEHTNQTQKSRSTLSIYDAWVNTDSPKLEHDLLERGVIPVPKLLRNVQ